MHLQLIREQSAEQFEIAPPSQETSDIWTISHKNPS